MKNLIIGLVIGVSGIFLTSAYIKQEEAPAENGTIATVHVVEKATRLIIRTTILGEESVAINVDAGYVEKEDMVNYTPVLKELERLRSMGYELHSSSLSTISYGKRSTDRPYHAYVFIKK